MNERIRFFLPNSTMSNSFVGFLEEFEDTKISLPAFKTKILGKYYISIMEDLHLNKHGHFTT